MPKIADLIASLRASLSQSDSGMGLDPRDRTQNQMAHGRLGACLAAMAAPGMAAAGLSHPVAWAALAPVTAWAVAETVQTARVRWSAPHGWDTAADLGGWLSGYLLLVLMVAAGAQPGGWMALAGVLGLVAPTAIGAGYWLKYGRVGP
jgi:hypothetical protein